MIFSLLIIPIIFCIYSYYAHHKEMHPIEYFSYSGASVIIICLAIAINQYSNCHDVAYRTGYVQKVEYYEPWTEVVHYTTTDSKGHTHHHTTYVPHSARYVLIDNLDRRISIKKGHWEEFVKKFQNKTFKNIYHLNEAWYSNGNMYFTTFDGKPERLTPCTDTYGFTNYILNHGNSFDFSPIPEETVSKYGLYEYPQIYTYKINPCLGGTEKQNRLLDKLNATNGSKNAFVWILLFKGPVDCGVLQEQYWKRGKNNDITICKGPGWAYTFSWNDDTVLIAEINAFALVNGVEDIIKYLGGLNSWKPKDFEVFNYISTEVSYLTYIITFIILIVANSVICNTMISNDYNNEEFGSE